MIVKKLYRKIKYKNWDKEREKFEKVTTIDYMGWFLFGFIPIYLIELNRYEDYNFEEIGEYTLEYGINKKYGHLMVRN